MGIRCGRYVRSPSKTNIQKSSRDCCLRSVCENTLTNILCKNLCVMEVYKESCVFERKRSQTHKRNRDARRSSREGPTLHSVAKDPISKAQKYKKTIFSRKCIQAVQIPGGLDNYKSFPSTQNLRQKYAKIPCERLQKQ